MYLLHGSGAKRVPAGTKSKGSPGLAPIVGGIKYGMLSQGYLNPYRVLSYRTGAEAHCPPTKLISVIVRVSATQASLFSTLSVRRPNTMCAWSRASLWSSSGYAHVAPFKVSLPAIGGWSCCNKIRKSLKFGIPSSLVYRTYVR